MGKIIEVNDANFENTIKEGIVLVDFWAEWCGPCKIIAPVLEEISNEMTEITVGKLDVDNNAQSVMKYGIRSIPSLFVFKDGEVVDSMLGAFPKQAIINIIKNHL